MKTKFILLFLSLLYFKSAESITLANRTNNDCYILIKSGFIFLGDSIPVALIRLSPNEFKSINEDLKYLYSVPNASKYLNPLSINIYDNKKNMDAGEQPLTSHDIAPIEYYFEIEPWYYIVTAEDGSIKINNDQEEAQEQDAILENIQNIMYNAIDEGLDVAELEKVD